MIILANQKRFKVFIIDPLMKRGAEKLALIEMQVSVLKRKVMNFNPSNDSSNITLHLQLNRNGFRQYNPYIIVVRPGLNWSLP